jgi:hypothetical protein
MKSIVKFAAPALLTLAAFGAQAQTIETDYPAVQAAGPVLAAPVAATAHAQRGAGQDAPFLVQSNFEGPKANPARAESKSTLTRAEVSRNVQARVQWVPADRRS